MLFTTRPHLFHFRLLALLAVLAGLASGCQSSRSGFAFRPAPGRVRPVAAVAMPDSAATIAALAPTAAAPPAGNRANGQGRTRVQKLPATVMVVMPTAGARIVQSAAGRPQPMRRRALLARPHATAEVGLGTTVLGVLGLVALPIALIGLLLSGGGLVWGLVAGAAALAVLVAYLDPFG